MSTETADFVTLLAGLSADELRQRLTDLDAESKAIKVLLRAVLSRERLRERRDFRPKAVANV